MQKERHLASRLLLIAMICFASGCRSEQSKQSPDDSSPNAPPSDTHMTTVSFEDQLSEIRNGESNTISLSNTIISDEQIQTLQPADDLQTLILDAGRLTDVGILHIARIKSLEYLRLRESPVTNESLQALTQCEQLRFLNLPDARFGDSQLKDVAAMPGLEMFRFHSSNVTDAGINDLLKSESLRFLHLINVNVTDMSVTAIIECANLESLYVDGGNISDAGIRRIYEARRDLHIHLDQQHHDLDRSDHKH